MERASAKVRWGLSPAGAAGLERAQAGDVEAFGIVCVELEPTLWRQAWSLCGDSAVTDDLVQEALITAWRQLDRFDRSCRFLTWVTGILLNLHRNFSRKKKPVSESQLNEAETESSDGRWPAPQSGLLAIVDPSRDPAEQTLLLERAALIRRCLQSLPKEQREVVQLRFYAGAELAEIATALGCPIGTVKSRLFHAIRKLAAMPELQDLLQENAWEESL